MTTLLVVLGAIVVIAAFTALYVWNRRLETEVDYDALESPQTEDERRAKQLGIALNQPSTTFSR